MVGLMENLILLDSKDLTDECYNKIKGKKFIGIIEDINGKIEMIKSKINAQEAVYFMTMAIQDIINNDSID